MSIETKNVLSLYYFCYYCYCYCCLEAASFDRGCGGCWLVIFVVRVWWLVVFVIVGEEKKKVGGKRERGVFLLFY